MTAPAEDPRGGEWIREEFRRAAERAEELPPYARPVVTRPIIGTPPAAGRGDTDSGGEVEVPECEHHSWAGLMALLDEHWPADIFPTREDDITRAAGARIVSLIRWVDRLRAARPAGDRAQPTEELREQLKQMAAHKIAYVKDPQLWGRSKVVEAVLALPAVAALLDAQAAVSRVEALWARIEGVMEFDMAGERYDAVTSVQQVLEHLRRALDGTT